MTHLLFILHIDVMSTQDAKSGRTALHLAVDCCQPSTAVVTLLLSSPCVILDNTNFANQTPLQLAKGRGHFSLVLLLKAHGARTTEGAYDHDTTGAISEDEQVPETVVLHVCHVKSCTKWIYNTEMSVSIQTIGFELIEMV